MKHLHQLPSNTFLKTVPSQQGLNRPRPSFTSFWTHVHARGVGNPALSPAFHTAHQLGPLPSASLLGKRHQLCGTTCHFGEAPKIRAPPFFPSRIRRASASRWLKGTPVGITGHRKGSGWHIFADFFSGPCGGDRTAQPGRKISPIRSTWRLLRHSFSWFLV